MKMTADQAKALANKSSVPQPDLMKALGDLNVSTSLTQMANSPSPPKSHPASKPCKDACKKNPRSSTLSKGRENKTEAEYREILERRGHQQIERERIKLRIGPPDQVCHYIPDYTYVDVVTGLWTLCEVKGPWEEDDARVKRMAAAEWCRQIGFAFVFAQKRKVEKKQPAQWVETKLA